MQLAANPQLCLSSTLTNVMQQATFRRIFGSIDQGALEPDNCSPGNINQQWTMATVQLPFGTYAVLRPKLGGCVKAANADRSLPYPSLSGDCIWDNKAIMGDAANLASHKPDFDLQGYKVAP